MQMITNHFNDNENYKAIWSPAPATHGRIQTDVLSSNRSAVQKTEAFHETLDKRFVINVHANCGGFSTEELLHYGFDAALAQYAAYSNMVATRKTLMPSGATKIRAIA